MAFGGKLLTSLLKTSSMGTRLLSKGSWENSLYKIKAVDIANEGKFKFVMLFVYNHGELGKGRKIIRGNRNSKTHTDLVNKVTKELRKLGLCLKVNGGGKMNHDNEKKIIEVYGRSRTYGQADYSAVKQLLKVGFPDYKIKIGKKHCKD